MSVESAIACIKRLRRDQSLHKAAKDNGEDAVATWALIKACGHDFTFDDFKQAPEAMYQEFGLNPMLLPYLL